MTRPVCLAFGLFVVQTFSGLLVADTPGRHPAYLHARSDLRAAQSLLRVHDEPRVTTHFRTADRAIARAIREIEKAAMVDRKDVNENPNVDTKLDRSERVKRAFALLVSARSDIAHDEDDHYAAAWRNVASRHIELAMDELRRAARELHIDLASG